MLRSTARDVGRIDSPYAAVTPAPLWAVVASEPALLSPLAGAWWGGELVDGRGVGVRER